MSTREIRVRGIVPGHAKGTALVSPQGISFLGDLDIMSGAVVGKAHVMQGTKVGGQVLVVPHTLGSAGAWRFLYQMFVHETNPVAIVQKAMPDSSLVQGAILAKIPIVCDPSEDIIALIKTGDLVEVDATNGVVRVTPVAERVRA